VRNQLEHCYNRITAFLYCGYQGKAFTSPHSKLIS